MASQTDYYMQAARCAVAHVRQRLQIQSHDNPKDLYRHGIIGNAVVKYRLSQMRDEIEKRAKELGFPVGGGGTPELWEWHIVKMAFMAQKWGVGNCGEMTAVAFVYLAKTYGIRPLDFISFVGKDEALVVIGSPVRVTTSNFNAWAQGSVICDPWSSWSGPSSHAGSRYKVHQMQSAYRLDADTPRYKGRL